MRSRDSGTVRVGQTLRFSYDDTYYTGLIVSGTSRTYSCLLECGKNRGLKKVFSMAEMLDCQEIFGSSIVQSLYQQASNLN